MSVDLHIRVGLGQLSQGDRVVVMTGQSIPVHLPLGSRMDVSDESLIIGVGRFLLAE